MSLPSVLIVDDDASFRNAIAALIEGQYRIVRCTSDGPSGLQSALELLPTLIVLDLSMPGIGGIEAAKRMFHSNAGVRIVFLSMILDKAIVDAAMATGALGYVVKTRVSSDLLPALAAALRGETFFSEIVPR